MSYYGRNDRVIRQKMRAIKKWAKDAQEKEKKRDTEPISRKINDHVRSLGERINGRPKEASRIELLRQQ